MIVAVVTVVAYTHIAFLISSLIISWKLQTNILSHSRVPPFRQSYMHKVFWFSSTMPKIFSERLTRMPFVLLESKVKTCIPFSIIYTICKQWTEYPTYSPCPEDCDVFDIPKDIITGPFKNAGQNISFWNCDQMWFWGMMDGREGLVALQSLLTLKRELELPTSSQIKPSKVYMTSRSIRALCTPGYCLQPLFLGSGGYVHPGGIVKCNLDYCQQNSYLTISFGYIWGKEGVRGRGLVTIYHFDP